MALTGRSVYVKAVTICGTTMSKATGFDVSDAGSRITSAEDDDVYITGQHVHSVDVTGSAVSRDTNATKGAGSGTTGAVAATLGDEDGVTTYTVAIASPNAVITGVDRSQAYGAWGETTLNFGAKSADGSTSPVSIT